VLTDGRLKVDTTMDDFAARVTGFAVEIDTVDPQKVAAIPGLIEARWIGSRLQLAVADADQETQAAVERLGGTSTEAIELTFADSVLSYLSRRRSELSFLNPVQAGGV